MIRQMFYIGDRDWSIGVYYDIKTNNDFDDIVEALIESGQKPAYAQRVVNELMHPNTGYTYTNYGKRFTLICISEATSHEELYNTISHEVRHAADHIGAYYGLYARGEESAYLQGEISRNMYEAVALLICPKCNCAKNAL